MSLLLGPHYDGGAVAPGGVAFGNVTVEGSLDAHFLIQNDGLYYQRADGVLTPVAAWITPQAGMSLYECRATALDLNPPPGSYDTWLDLAQSWSWGWSLRASRTITGNTYRNDRFSQTGFDDFYEPVSGTSGAFLLEIRLKSAPGVIVASGNVTVIVDGDA